MSVRPDLKRSLLLASLLLVPALVGPPLPALAQQTAPETPAEAQATPAPQAPATPPAVPPAEPTPEETLRDNQAALAELESSMSLSQDTIDRLKAEIAEMNGDSTRQNAALIAAGQRVKLAEIEVASMEERLGNLIAEEMEVRSRLDGADTDIANVLAALERIGRNPPPAIIVNPTDALGSARSALLISDILPQLRTKADAVTTDLKELTRIKAEAVAEEEQLRANFAVLEEEQLRIATLIAAKKQGVQIVSGQLAAEEQAAADMATSAANLKDLIAGLTARANAVTSATSRTQTPGAAPMPEAEVRAALANTSRTAPAVPFAAARGYLSRPATGTDAIQFGASDGFGGIAEGLSVATRQQAQVVAPADGWVMYKGPYLNYGQIIILNPGDDYTILLAGLDTVSVNIGQFVLLGEPVGTMGSHTIGHSAQASAGAGQPTLYIELRKANEPIDPAGWWAPAPTGTATTQTNDATQENNQSG